MLIPVRLRMYIVLLERAKHVGALVKMAIINIRLPSKSLQQRLLAVSLCQESGETKADSTLNDKVSSTSKEFRGSKQFFSTARKIILGSVAKVISRTTAWAKNSRTFSLSSAFPEGV
jgi:hypothetical protein